MTAILLFATALAGDARELAAGTWCTQGESFGGATVTRVEVHPEFERCWLAAADGAMVAEIVAADGVHTGQCSGGGRTLFPRPELVEGAVGRIDLEPICARLQAAPATAPVALAPVGLALAAAAALGGAGWLLRRRALDALAQLLLGLAVPLATTAPALFDGGGAGWEKLRVGLGLARDAGWGPGYALWMRPAVALLGVTPDAIFWTNLGFAALWPPLVGAVAERLASRRAGWIAAAAAAFLPVHVAMARSEAMHTSAVTWGTLAVLGAVVAATTAGAEAVVGAAVAVAAAVAAIATRGDLGVVLPVIAAAALRAPAAVGRLRVLASAATAGLLAAPWLHTESGALLPGDPLTPMRIVAALAPHFGALTPSGGYLVSLHAALTPPLWWGVALTGVWAAPRRAAGFALAWGALAGLPFLLKVEPAPDALRLQAFAQGGFVLLVAFVPWRDLRILAAAFALSVWFGPSLAGPAWLHREEWRFFVETARRLPAGTVVRLDPSRPHVDAAAEVLSTVGSARFTADPADRCDYEYRGAALLPPDAPAAGDPDVHEVTAVDVDGDGAPHRFRMELHRSTP